MSVPGSEPAGQAALEAFDAASVDGTVKLGADFIERWTRELGEEELKAYLALASRCARSAAFTAEERRALLEPLCRKPAAVIARLEGRELVETLEKDGVLHVNLPFVDADGRHRGHRVRPGIAEALEYQRQMTEELCDVAAKDETEELRFSYLERYPELAEEYEAFRRSEEPDMRSWRLWLELSRHHLRVFERRYGTLRDSHSELFKASLEQLLRLRLDVIDAICEEVVSRREEVFREVGDGWIVALPQADFTALPLIQNLSERFDVGPEQIYLNVLESFGLAGFTIVAVDEQGMMGNLLLPTTTGLTKSEERVLFLRPDERERGKDSPRTRERYRRARNKYANHLIRCGLDTVLDFLSRDRVRDLDALLQVVTERVADALELLPNPYPGEEYEPVTLELVIDRFDAMRS